MKKKIIIITICALAILAVVLVSVLGKPKAQSLSYQITTIHPTSISSSVTATGTVEPIKQVEVGTQVSGIISKIYVDYNSEVKAGQLIAELDRSVLATELEASKANLNASKTEYEYQSANYTRIKGLYDKGLVSATDYETAEYSFSKAKYSYQQAQANIQKAEKNLGYAWIYSPIDGIVLSRAVDEGQTVAAGFSTPTLFTIANDLKKMQVIADVDEADIGEVAQGQRVTFEVDAYPDDIFSGEVTQVRLLATTTSNVVTYEVVIDAPNPDLKLKPGLTANVSIYTLDKQNIIAVPLRALRFTPDNYKGTIPEKCVWGQGTDGSAYPIEVTTGVSDGVNTEIISGLKIGDKVITGTRLSNGTPAGAVSQGDSAQPAKSGNSNPFMPKPPTQGQNKRTK
ncbi:MAG: efflux RND transporter periplasmic adaptor subunit [Bacteroidales bacterium]|nr:efflux RND transporter periplasmic adaptor subunit [Bacteroidales bacterium]MDD4670614.1 efflux RND transporter periplasmic adaptor subunit [Bacteroidales bacterium]